MFLNNFIRPNKSNLRILNWENMLAINNNLWESILTSNELIVDLNDIDTFKPDGLAFVFYLIQQRYYKNHARTGVILPRQEKQKNYIENFGFLKLANTSIFQIMNPDFPDLPSETKLQKKKRIIELIEQIDGDNWRFVIPKYYNETNDLISEYLGSNKMDDLYDKGIRPLSEVLYEFATNIVIHGGYQSSNGLGCISITPPLANYPKFRFSFFDIGEGIKKRLVKKDNFDENISEKEAVSEALIYRLRNPEKRVNGIYYVLPLISKFNGTIQIRTGGILFKINFPKLGIKYESLLSNFNSNHEAAKSWFINNSEIYRTPNLPGTNVIIDMEIRGAKWDS